MDGSEETMIPIITTFWGQDPAKLSALEDHLRQNDIRSWAYYWGFNGHGLKIREYPDVEYYNEPYEMYGKQIGQNLTHWGLWSALKMMSEKYHGHDKWMIIEDDLRFNDGWQEIYHDVMEDVPDNWDMVFFGNCCTNADESIKITDNLYFGTSLCLHWYMIRKKALDILLETNRTIKARIDVQMHKDSYPHLHTYYVKPSLATQSDTHLEP